MVAVLLLLVVTPAFAQSVRSALVLEQAGQLEQAFNEYRLVLAGNPGELAAFEGVRRLSEPLGRYDTLVAVSRRLMKAKPDQSEFALGLVDGLLGAKRQAEGLSEARKAAKTWPLRQVVVADILVRRHEYAEAISMYVRAREREKDPTAYSDRLIDLYEKQKQYVQATREIAQALNRRPDMLDLYRQKLSSYAPKAGAGSLLAELQKVSDPAVRARAEAAVYLATGKDAEALRVLKPVLDATALSQFARECEDQGAPRVALAIYQEQRRHADAARVLRRLGRTAEAQAELSQETGPAGQFELAELQREQGEFKTSVDAYSKVLRQQPGNEAAAYGLASAYLGLGNPTAARQAVVKLKPSDRLLLLQARAFFYEGSLDSTQRYISELAKQFPQSMLVNDALELALLVAEGAKNPDATKELARAMLNYEGGAVANGIIRSQALAKGEGPVAEQAHFLLSRFQRRGKKPKDALATLDTFLTRFAKSPLRAKARLEQAYIYRDDLKDDGKYREALQQLMLDYPASPYVPIARNLLDDAKRSVGAGDVR